MSNDEIVLQFTELRAQKAPTTLKDGLHDKIERRGESQFKKSHALRGLVLLWLCAIHIFGIYYFAKGFLLTRLILDDESKCDASPAQVAGTSITLHEGCWYPKTFSKGIVIIIDALRYDFTVPFLPSQPDEVPRQFHNALPVLYETASTRPENAFLLPFLADPPTTTLQRLKGLTTGTLPTLIDAGSNFAGTAIEEDNLLAQMRSLGKTIVHLGDDTWQALFPGYFNEDMSHPYDSFNVWDLHTVDNGVTTHLLPLLQSENKTRWDFIFGHYLGVDHAGHRYGPDHPAMKNKLLQMNEIILLLIDAIDNDTLLVVMGDHGMDTKGDHGGESDEEVEAALWMYSPRPAFGRTHTDFSMPPANAKLRPVRQTDLVSTLSLLFGLPIPFNNIGAPIEEAFSRPDGPDWRALALVNQITVAQIQRYQEAYSAARNLDSDVDQHTLHEKAISLLASAASGSEGTHGRFREAYHALRDYEGRTLSLYRRLWANFNLVDMAWGIIILTSGSICLAIFSAIGSQVDIVGMAKAGSIGALIGSPMAVLLDSILSYQLRPEIAILGLILGSLFTMAPRFLSRTAKPIRMLPDSLWSWVAFLFTVSQAAGFASNSYTIHEDSILLFFLSTFGFLSCASSLRQSDLSDRILGAVHSILFTLFTRIASFSRLCREEQMPGCRSTFYASTNSSTSAPWQIFLPFVIAIALPVFVKARYKGTASYVGPAVFWVGFCFRIGLLLIAVYWMLDGIDNGGWLQGTLSPETLKKVTLALSRSVIGIAIIVGIITIGLASPCIDIVRARPKTTERRPEEGKSPSNRAVAVLGYANVHGTRYFMLLPIFILLTSVLLPPMGQFSIAICACQILSLLEILDANSLTISRSSSSHQNQSTTAVGPILLAMLGSFHFFKTGHQATLASIQWNAAFVPFRTITYPWTPLLIVFNTFGPQILCAAAVPLTVLWKRPVERGAEWMENLLSDVMTAMLGHMSYYATMQLATTVWAGHLRRHLMLYRVFMPRFLMASLLLVIVDLMLILVAWGFVRVNTLSVGKAMGY